MHDARGNLTEDWTTNPTTRFIYDLQNRLTCVYTGAATTTCPSNSTALSYDALSRLFQTSVNGGSITRFMYDGANIIGESNGSNNLLRRYVHGAGVDEPLVWYEGSGTADRRYYSADERGSIVAVTNGSGASITINTYDDYGVGGGSNQGRFQYTGQAWIPEIRLYHYKARAYSPALGRFLQTDPVGYSAGPNLYAYVGDDPLNNGDPTGKDCVSRGGTTTCTTKVYSVSFRTPPGFHDPRTGQANYHFYSIPAHSLQGDQVTRDWVTNHPTPAPVNNPATPSGAVNDATPAIGGLLPVNVSPVLSIATTNKLDGNPVVLNVTLEGHQLASGEVVRETQRNRDGTSTIQNWGEGNAVWQGSNSSFADDINNVWRSQVPPPPARPASPGQCQSHPGGC